MPKLSDVFLSLLGNTLASGGMSPRDQIALKQDQQRIDLSKAEQTRQNLSSLAEINQHYNQLPPDFVGPHDAGSFTPPPNQSSLVGLTPGTTLQPVKRSEKISYYNPKTNGISSQVVPLDRGQTGTMNNAPLQLLGQQTNVLKDLYDKTDGDERAAAHDAQAASLELPKGVGQTALDMAAKGLGLPSTIVQSPQYQEAGARLLAAVQRQQQATKIKSDLFARMMNSSGASPSPAPASPGPTLGTIRVRSKQTGQTGSIPSANFNAALYDQI